MPPPEGPFFSSKPLLYFGEEPSTTEVKGIQIQGISPPQRARSPFGMARDYPGYYGPAPLGAGRKMMQRQVPTYLPGWGNRPPYYRYNPGNSGYPPFPARWGANPQ